MMSRVQKRVDGIRGERDGAVRAAAGIAMIGLLVGLCAFFVALAPRV
jgi:hypothetical protein